MERYRNAFRSVAAFPRRHWLASVATFSLTLVWAAAYTMLTHGEVIGERLQYLGGKLRHAGSEVVIVDESKRSRVYDREHEELVRTRRSYRDADQRAKQCETYMDAVLKIQRQPAEDAIRAAGKPNQRHADVATARR